MCFVWISEQTPTFTLCSINRFVLCFLGGECLLRAFESSPYMKQICFVFKGLNHLLNFKNKVLHTIAKLSRCTPTREMHVAFEIQYVCGAYYKTLQAVYRSHTKS